jgi:hypothetical protein
VRLSFMVIKCEELLPRDRRVHQSTRKRSMLPYYIWAAYFAVLLVAVQALPTFTEQLVRLHSKARAFFRRAGRRIQGCGARKILPATPTFCRGRCALSCARPPPSGSTWFFCLVLARPRRGRAWLGWPRRRRQSRGGGGGGSGGLRPGAGRGPGAAPLPAKLLH